MSKSSELQEHGVILRKLAYSDTDEIITVLFEKSGVRRLFVRGSRKSKKRFGGRIDLFRKLNFHFKPRLEGLATLLQAEDVPEKPLILEDDLFAYAFLGYLAEVITEFYPEDLPSDEIFHLWQDVSKLASVRELDLAHALFATLKFMDDAGYSKQASEKYKDLFSGGVSFEKLTNIICQKGSRDIRKFATEILSYPQEILQKRLKTLTFLVSVIET